MGTFRRAGFAAALAAAPVGLAYRFALAYRARAGYPRRHPPAFSPADVGLPFETTSIRSAGLDLPAWFIPARDGAPGPGVVLVHGWESARDRTLPMALFLHAAGFHCLTFDVRGHGANPAEVAPLSAGEFGQDALAAFRTLLGRTEVTIGAISGHSMGAIGAILAAAADPSVAALVATSGPADPYRLTRETFRLAHLPIPDPIAYPLAWLTTRVYVRTRGHVVDTISATRAIRVYRGPVLLAHGTEDAVVPVAHLALLEAAARASRSGARASRSGASGRGGEPREPAPAAPVESLVVEGGHHSWLYEFPAYRATVARFLATALGGPLDPAAAADAAAAVPAVRMPDSEAPFAAVAAEPGGLRTLAGVALPGATRRPAGGPAGLTGAGPVAATPMSEP